ncbi:MAG: hypothetical protein LBJ02_00780 [Bifidobacteriaceae bacterium]|jgi:hypothetical protein|nr:hypothetical protein [Bifidobacteriaceae bacterium]
MKPAEDLTHGVSLDMDAEDLLDQPEDPRFDPTTAALLTAARRLEPTSGQAAEQTPHQATDEPPGPARLSYPEILAGANLGFTAQQGGSLLADHDGLVFLGRLWDSRRVAGAPVGERRIPAAVWEAASQRTADGQATAALLEATGHRLPTDFGQQLDFHLTMWQAQPALAVRSAGAVPDAVPTVRCESPVWVEVTSQPGGLEVEFQSPFPGHFMVELHFPDGTTARCRTPALGANQTHSVTFPPSVRELPKSIRVTREVSG